MVEVFAVGNDEAGLVPNHSEPPISIPTLKSVLTVLLMG
jgi:hypothetical protein